MRKILILVGVATVSCLSADEAKVPLDGQQLDHALMARAQSSKARLHPTRHFDSFSDVQFEKELDGEARHVANTARRSPGAVGRHRGGAVAAANIDLENSQHVDVEGAKVHVNPVTNSEYLEFVQSTGHKAPKHWKGGTFPLGKGDQPVTNVNFQDAQAYAKWANKRLPTHSEWMNAADQMSWDMEMPDNEWTSSITGTKDRGVKQVILDRSGSVSTMNPLDTNLSTGFRVVTPSSWDLPKPRGDAFMTPEGDDILPDQSLETPSGSVIDPGDTPYDYGE